MCLGIPARIVELRDDPPDLAVADILGTRRTINVGLLEERVIPGDWVLLHMGFAMDRIHESAAKSAMRGLEMMGRGETDPEPQEPESQEVTQWAS